MENLEFAVTSKYFSVYRAFKEEAEKLGLPWAERFNPFTEEKSTTRNCIWIADNWSHADGRGVGMSFSNTSGERIDLDTNFQGALDQVKFMLANSIRVMTVEQVEKELGYKVKIIK